MNYKIGICDDEVMQIKINALFIKEIAKRNNYDISLIGFQSSKQLTSHLSKNSLDILFIDIDMGEESGITTATNLTKSNPNLVIVFITGHREFTNEAFDIEAFGYILKPVEEKKIERVFKKAILQATAIKSQLPSSTLVITEDNLKKKINQRDIIYISRQQTKSVIYTSFAEYKVYETITSLYNRLESNFLRINQSDIVNMREIKEIRENHVFLKNNIDMTLGRTFRKQAIDTYYKFSE